MAEPHNASFEQKHQSRLRLHKRFWRNTFSLEVSVDRWINGSLFFVWVTCADNLQTNGGFCNRNCPPSVYSLAPFPISDCERRLHLPVISRVYFGGGSLRHFCFFMNRLLCCGALRSQGFESESVQCLRVYVRFVQFCLCVCVCKLWMFSPSSGCGDVCLINVNASLCAAPRAGSISHLTGF